MVRQRTLIIGMFLIFGLLVFGAIKFIVEPAGSLSVDTQSLRTQSDAASKLVYEDIDNLKHKTVIRNRIFTARPDLPVPTNQWYSSVAFAQTSEPLFVYPLAVKMNGDGFGVSYPKVVSTADTVFASYNPDLRVSFEKNNMDALIASHDDLSVAISQKSKDETVSEIRLTHGSPYVFASVLPKKSFRILADDFSLVEKGDNFVLFTVHGKFFALFFSRNEVMTAEQDKRGIDVFVSDRGARFSIAVLPDSKSLDVFKKYAFDPIVSTEASFDADGKAMKSRFAITTQNNAETLFALLPKSTLAFDADMKHLQPIGKYQTLRGEQTLYQGKSFGFSRDMPDLLLQLPVSSLSSAEQERLRSLVRDDVSNISITEEDTYFLGKKLFALANILDIAEQLDMDSESAVLRMKIRSELELWRSNTLAKESKKKYFYYDSLVKGIVGETASFGSELFNDHHFHYGYFIYAASVLARYDKEYLADNERFINLLVQDIANTDRKDTAFPYLRGFDAYEGHSFASGQGLFADGNNQESSSEAVNAWYALYLWSDAIGNKKLEEMARYLYSEESASAIRDWLNIDRSDARFANFKHSFISLVWGGKLDAATWFNARPEARLGIQLLPISPGSLYLGQDTKRVQENMLSEPEFRNPTMFKDYLAMYSAFYDSDGARRQIQSLKPEDIDGANSKSFMEAWLMTSKK
ncbi:MAG: glycosyl hydrolase [Candidatus Moranbacteria bacterium]|nr:glycosyl hydrolase [Candidatus Moranbacteria bacterium]